jgi:hypothetical protein
VYGIQLSRIGDRAAMGASSVVADERGPVALQEHAPTHDVRIPRRRSGIAVFRVPRT